MLIPREFLDRFGRVASAAGFRAEAGGAAGGPGLRAWTKRTPGVRPRVYLSAGIHGDEPAPPWALLHLVEAGILDARCTWFLCPLLNPTGFTHGSRENDAHVDLNRDYLVPRTPEVQAHVRWLQTQPNFDLVICVHEDWEATGFYLYELNPDQRPTLATAMIAAAGALCPLEPALVIDGRPVDEPGIIRPVGDPLLRETWPEAIYLHHRHARLVYTIETPSALPLPQRVATLVAALSAALVVLVGPVAPAA